MAATPIEHVQSDACKLSDGMGCGGSKVKFTGDSYTYANAAHLLMRLVDAEIECDSNFKKALGISDQ